MAAEGLGYLAALLGGMQQGKLMKQKRELTSSQLAIRKAEAEQKALDRIATGKYRNNQLELQRQNIDLSKANLDQKLNNTDDIYELATQAGGNLKASVAGIPERMATKSTPKSWQSEVAAARAGVRTPYESLRSLVKDPRMKKRYPNMTEEALLANFGGAVPQWMTDSNVDPATPDWAQQYKPDRDAINRVRQNGFNSGVTNPSWYIQRELPAYQQIMADLEGLPDAAERAIQIHGPLTGTTAQETLELLQGRRPRQTYMPTEQYKQEYGTDPLSQARGNLSFNEYGETVDETGQSLDRLAEQQNIPLDDSQVPMPGEAQQRTNNYREQIPTSQAAQVNDVMLPERFKEIKAKNNFNQIAFSEKLTGLAYDTLLKKGAVEGKELQNINLHIKNAADQMQLKYLEPKLLADIDTKVAQAFSSRMNVAINGGKLFSDIKKAHDINVNMKQTNLSKTMASLPNNLEYQRFLSGDETKRKAFDDYLSNRTNVVPQGLTPSLTEFATLIREMREDLKNAITAQTNFKNNGGDFVTLIDQIGSELAKPTTRKAMTIGGEDKPNAATKATTRGPVITPGKKPAAGSDRNAIPVPKLKT
jgi:hypothetical protein